MKSPKLRFFLPKMKLKLFITGDMNATEVSIDKLPNPINCYFETIKAENSQQLRTCFTHKALIIDVSRRIKGKQAILTWANNEVFGGRYDVLKIVSRSTSQLKLLVTFTPQGWGSGFRAHYEFYLSNGKIEKMDLQYAD